MPHIEKLVGREIGHIVLEDILGEGGMGAVFLGRDKTLHREVAVKVIRGEYRLNEEAKARFIREARILSRLNHPGICTVFDFISDDEFDFLILELIEGMSLRQALHHGLKHKEKLSVARQLLEVLATVHSANVVHRDLKPENLMIQPNGQIKVLDFGVARSSDEGWMSLYEATTIDPEMQSNGLSHLSDVEFVNATGSYVRTRIGTVLGTAGYMSPEQARGEPATSASDIFSTGLIFQEMFSGHPAFERGIDRGELLERSANGKTRPITGVPSDLRRLLRRMTSHSPGSRPSAIDALEKLQWILDAPKRRRGVLFRMAGLALIILVGYLLLQQRVRIIRAEMMQQMAQHRVERAAQMAAIQTEKSFTGETLIQKARDSSDPEEKSTILVEAAYSFWMANMKLRAEGCIRAALAVDPDVTVDFTRYRVEFRLLFEEIRLSFQEE